MLIATRSVGGAPRKRCPEVPADRRSRAAFRRTRLIVTHRPPACGAGAGRSGPRTSARPRRGSREGRSAFGAARSPAGRRRVAELLAPATRQVRRSNRRLCQIAPRSVGGGQDLRDRAERNLAELLREHRHDSLRPAWSGPSPPAGCRGRRRRGGRRVERHTDRRERAVGSSARAGIARRDEPEVVGGPRRQARERLGHVARPVPDPALRLRPRPVARRRPVFEPPRRRPPSRVDRARKRRRRRTNVLRRARVYGGRERRAEALVAADARAGRVRRDETVVVGGRRPAAVSATTRR